MARTWTPHIRRRTPAQIVVPPGEVRLLESHHALDFRMEMGVWPFHKVCWVVIGKGSLEFETRASAVGADDFLLLPAGRPHRFVDAPARPLTLMMFCISTQLLAAPRQPDLSRLWRRGLKKCPAGQVAHAKSAFHRTELLALFRRSLREQARKDDGWTAAIRVCAENLIIEIARGHLMPREAWDRSGRQAIMGAVEYTDLHPYEHLQIETMAERCGMSPRRFTTLFKKQTGETFNRYLTRRRIEYAQTRLRETGHILYACHESGFNDLGYFYRVFKRTTGCTPGQYLEASPE